MDKEAELEKTNEVSKENVHNLANQTPMLVVKVEVRGDSDYNRELQLKYYGVRQSRRLGQYSVVTTAPLIVNMADKTVTNCESDQPSQDEVNNDQATLEDNLSPFETLKANFFRA